jgi:hypothetical protein
MEFTDDPHPDSPVEWADNPLSNFLERASRTVTPNWCQTEEHWTARVTQTLFTDCPCCLLFRGLVIGGVLGGILGAAVATVIVLVLP